MKEGMIALSQHPCEAIVKTDVLYNGKAVYMVRYNGKCGIMDASGAMIVPPIYDEIHAPESYKDRNTFCVDSFYDSERNYKYPWGIIRLDGTQVTDRFSFSYVEHFRNGYCIVKQGSNVYAVIDTNGKYVIPFGVYVNMFYTDCDRKIKAQTADGQEVLLNAETLERL